MARISTTRLSVDGSTPSNQCIAGSASHSSARISAYSADFVGKCLNSSASEMAAAAATLLVVVPAKPLRAKQRLAAPKMSCRLRSLVMRKVDMGRVSNHSPRQCQETYCSALGRNHSVFGRRMPSDLIRGWVPVRVKKTRQKRSPITGLDRLESQRAADPVD